MLWIIILIIVLIVYYIRKSKSEKPVKFPKVTVIILSIATAITIVTSTISSYSRNYILENADYINSSKIKKFDFKGLSFEYPGNWSVDKEVIEDNLAYHVVCEKNGNNSSEILTITWLTYESSSSELVDFIENVMESMKEEISHRNAKTGNIYNSNYIGISCKSVDFSGSLLNEQYYGNISAFNLNGNTFLVLKQSDKKSKLNSEFKIIEESLKKH